METNVNIKQTFFGFGLMIISIIGSFITNNNF